MEYGLRAEALALPDEDQEELKQLIDEWLEYYQPASPGQRALLDRSVYSTLQLRRQVAERLREMPGMEQALIVALTGCGQEAGIGLHLSKPVDPEALIALVSSERPRDPGPGVRSWPSPPPAVASRRQRPRRLFERALAIRSDNPL